LKARVLERLTGSPLMFWTGHVQKKACASIDAACARPTRTSASRPATRYGSGSGNSSFSRSAYDTMHGSV
jgi:hypothetical protein